MSQSRVNRIATDILRFLSLCPKGATEIEITDNVCGRTGLIAVIIRQIVESGEVVKIGSGVRGAPYVYCFKAIESKAGAEPDSVQVETEEFVV